jgi:DNA repair protein RadC
VGRFQYLETASRILADAESLAGLARMSVAELAEMPEVGPATAGAIRAALELGRRLMGESIGEAPQIRSPSDAATLLLPEMQTLEQEHLVTIILDTRNRLLTIHTIYIGSLNTSVVRVGELFREAIRRNAAAILVAHNHPSGDPAPSPEDVAVTRQIVEAGKLMDIDVLDHLVIGRGRFVSLKERGLGF